MPLILVVEDDADIRSFLVSGLSGYRVEIAKDGGSGLRSAREYLPDLVITDLMMPVMDGVALCRALKTNEETSHIPVIMLTAKTALEHQVEGLQTGADDYVTKPFHMILLQVRIQNLLQSRRLLRERFRREFMLPGHYSVPENSLDQAFFERVMEVLDAHVPDAEFTADAFAQKMKMSLSTLSRKLKALTDETPAKMIWNVRLKKAAGLLTSTQLTITEIAFEVGYMDSNHFSRQFKRYYGLTPSTYREKGGVL